MTEVTEKELSEKAVAPRVTLEGLEANIRANYTFNVLDVIEALNKANPDDQVPVDPNLRVLTLAVLVLNNGYTVVGESACAFPENYNADIGNRLAIEAAKKKIWPLMGYALKQEQHLKADSTVKGRLEAEIKEVEDRLGKLTLFLESDTYHALPFAERELLVDQQMSMSDYFNILKKRLALFID